MRRTPGAATQSYSSHGVRLKVRYTEERKGKGPEAKGSRDNLRKAGKKEAKLRPGFYK